MIDKINGEIEIPYSLFKSIELGSEKHIPSKYLISHANYSCICKDSFVSVECEYQIRVFDSLERAKNLSSVVKGGNDGNNNKESIQLVSQKATILNSSIKYSKNNHQNIGNSESCDAIILTSGSHYYLHTSTSGRYTVKLELSVPYLTVKEAGMDLSIPQCSNNSVFFRVPHSNANIKIFNSFLDTQSFLKWSEKNSKESNNFTVTFVKLANELSLKAQWTINEDFISNKISLKNDNINQISQPKVTVKPNVIVSQNLLCSIGEGLLLLKYKIDYKIIAGTLSSFNIEIEDNVNIISVDGKAMKRWEVVELDIPESQKHKRVIQIQLDYGFDTNYTIDISGEYSMKDTSGELNIPSMICKGDEISRQRGFLGVEARTNVEISDIGNEVLSVVDVRELPLELCKMANHPILLSYKFLEPHFQLKLRVKRNLDCAVLVSIVEEMSWVTTVSYSGKMIHQMILNIKNTQKQFLRVQIGFNYEVWSCMMDGEPCKPSIIENGSNGGCLLIPILKPGVFDQNTPIKIEIVILQEEIHHFNEKSGKGQFNFVIPKIDLPLRACFASVYLPNGTIASKFTGVLKQVSFFSSTPPSASQPSSTTNSFVTQQYNRPRGFGNRNDSICDLASHEDSSRVFSKQKNSYFSSSNSSGGGGGGNKRRGVVPVFVDIPKTSTFYYFEQILLSGDKDLSFGFDYKSIKQKIRR
ncbi:hypothetical protein RB653_006814 [Dictyostelium firmibasis]|uniref:Uncharacterized protein n=1 Tax=Dictyostelium firmibasis TaxID=79012 RepID=A0AAN7TTL7_9MYCE